MAEEKILVIYASIYNELDKYIQGDVLNCRVRVKENWYFIKEEAGNNKISVVKKLNDNHNFELILIHAGNNDDNLKGLKKALNGISFKIYGFHKFRDEQIIEHIEKYDTNWIITHYKRKSLDNRISENLHLFFPLDVDMQALMILWEEKKEDVSNYCNEMRMFWSDEIINKKWDNISELTKKLPDNSMKMGSNEFIALLDTISSGEWDGKNHFQNWFYQINSLIK